jgi:hypothetical protein
MSVNLTGTKLSVEDLMNNEAGVEMFVLWEER